MDRFKREPSFGSVGGSFGAGASSHSRLKVGPIASRSGEHALRYGLMREVLLTYLSPILVDSVLTRALDARHLTPAALSETQLAELASDIMVGLRLFVPEDRLPTLMLALADVLESPT
jgi:hypothetical protein